MGLLAAMQGQAERALLLVGAKTATARAAIQSPLSPAEQENLDTKLAPARAALGLPAAAAAWRTARPSRWTRRSFWHCTPSADVKLRVASGEWRVATSPWDRGRLARQHHHSVPRGLTLLGSSAGSLVRGLRSPERLCIVATGRYDGHSVPRVTAIRCSGGARCFSITSMNG